MTPETAAVAALIPEAATPGDILRVRVRLTEAQHRALDYPAIRRLAEERGYRLHGGVQADIVRPDRVRIQGFDVEASEHDALDAWLDENALDTPHRVGLHELLGEALERVSGRDTASGGVFVTVSLEAENVGRYRYVAYNYQRGATVFVGPSGAGKSMLMRCVELALFADGRRELTNLGTWLMPHTDFATILLTFKVGEQLYRVRRTYRLEGRKATVDFEREGADGWESLNAESSGETAARIVATVGMTRDVFVMSSYVRQKDPALFLSASAAERKRLFGEVIEPTGVWQDAAASAAKALTEVTRGLEAAAVQIRERQERVKERPELERVSKRFDGEAMYAAENLRLSELAWVKAQAAVHANAAHAAEVRHLTAERDRVRAEHAQRIQLAEGEAARRRASVEDFRERRDEARREFARLTGSKSHTERCPRCEQVLDEQATAASIRNLTRDIDALTITLTGEEKKLAEAEQIAERARTDRAAANRVAEAERAAAAAADDTADEAALIRAAEVARVDRDKRRRELDETTAELVRARQRLEQLQDAEVELAALVEQGNVLCERMDMLSLAARAFGRDGIPVLLVEAALPRFETDVNDLLRRFPNAAGGVFTVRFDTQREQANGKLAEVLYVMVTAPDGAEQEFVTLSGGQERRVVICVAVALAKLVGNRSGLLMIDEPEGLDDAGKEALYELLVELVDAGVFEVVLCVSHSSLLIDRFGSRVTVEELDGVSRLVAA